LFDPPGGVALRSAIVGFPAPFTTALSEPASPPSSPASSSTALGPVNAVLTSPQ
jgi:hypothetical protein